MTDHDDHINPQQPDGDVPMEGDIDDEQQQPRRAASAEFIVESDVNSDVAIREAMDPANQSLGEALRLSFRVLQLVMVVLIVLFFTSGFQTVESSQSGVFTRFGKIVSIDGSEALESGLQPTFWPYPIGEFVLIDVENRSVDLGDTFWPFTPGMSLEEATEKASVHNILRPGRDGSLLTRDGDLVHIKLAAQYQIDDPVTFLRNVPQTVMDDVPSRETGEIAPVAAADKLVTVALERAAVRVSAALTLQDMIEPSEDTRYQIRRTAQALLDEIQCGISITTINIPQTTAPLAIRKAFGELQRARGDADAHVEDARARSERDLLQTAGENYGPLLVLIREYQAHVDANDEAAAAEALARINEELESDRTSGEASRTISRAKAYASEIEATLGAEARRFQSVYAVYQDSPDLVIRQLWLQAYETVLTQNDAEIFFVPDAMAGLTMLTNGLAEVADMRRQRKLDFKQRRSATEGLDDLISDYRYLDSEDINTDGPGRRFRIGEDGELRGARQR